MGVVANTSSLGQKKCPKELPEQKIEVSVSRKYAGHYQHQYPELFKVRWPKEETE